MIGNERKRVSKTSIKIMVKNMNIIGDDHVVSVGINPACSLIF